MMLAGLLLLAVGGADLARASVPPHRRRVRAAVVGLALAVAVTLAAVSGVTVFGILVPPLFALGWLLAVPSADSVRRPRAGALPVVLLIAVTVVLLVVPVPADDTAPLWHWWSQAPVLAGRDLPVVILAVGVALFLAESANLVVRSALAVAQVPGTDVPPCAGEVEGSVTEPDEGEGTGDVDAETDAAASERAVAAAEAVSLPILKGGRVIGPLERLLIAALSLAGAFTVVAALFAAKGIVRFPEISRDRGAGDRAEYFLVGSMVSWTIAFAAAGLLWSVGFVP